jgi:regulator of protease activity HflC (stomatin/prohibitin superfamily)
MFGLNPTVLLVLGGIWLASLGGVAWKVNSAAEARCNAAALRAELAAVRADLANAEGAARVAEAASRTLNAEAMDRDARIRQYETTLATRDPCILTPDDATRLRDLGGPR